MERTFETYRRLHDICNGTSHKSDPDSSTNRTHKKLSPTKCIQRYGNSYIIKFNQGRYNFIIGPHWIGVLVTIAIIFGGSYVNINLLDNNSSWSLSVKNYLKMFIHTLSILTTFLLLCTATTEPGIVYDNSSGGLEEGNESNIRETTYCSICSVYQWRAKKIYHCSDCNYCIEEMDHHCPWMGQCIGKKNVYWFVLFNFSWVILFSEFVYVAYFASSN